MPFSKISSACLKNILESFCENSFDAIVITEASEGYKIVYANPRFCKMTGYSLEELIGNTPKILQGEKTNQQILDRMHRQLLNKEHFHGATTNYRKNGEPYPVEWNITPIRDADGNVSYFISIQKDLTQLKTIVSRLKNSNEHFRKFLLSISHRLKSGTTPGVTELFNEQQEMLTNDVLENAQLYSSELRTDESIELFGETEFFDCDNDLHGMLVTSEQKEQVSAVDYASQLTFDLDANHLQQLIDEIRNTISLLPYSNQMAEDILHLGQEIQFVANEIFHLEDFVGISSVLAELARENLRGRDSVPSSMVLEFYDALFNDLQTWLKSVFIDRTAQNIHEYDASIISSARQILILQKQ